MSVSTRNLAGWWLARALLAAVMLCSPFAAAAGPVEDAQASLATIANSALPQLAKLRTKPERAEAVRGILRQHFDLSGMGRFMLGRYWRQASEQERRDYLIAFEDLVVQSFAAGLEDHSVERVAVQAGRPTGEQAATLVSEIFLSNRPEKPFRVDWHFRQLDGSYRVSDLVIEGLSVNILLRDAFVQSTQAGGGDVADFIRKLKLITAPD